VSPDECATKGLACAEISGDPNSEKEGFGKFSGETGSAYLGIGSSGDNGRGDLDRDCSPLDDFDDVSDIRREESVAES
jgi:hypothetical protein